MSADRAVYSWRHLTPIYMSSTLNPLNSSLLATALVPIAAGLHVTIGSTVILVTSLYLACTVAQPTAGKLADEFGPRRVFLPGIVLVGIGTSAGYPSAMLLIRRRAEAAGLEKPPGGVLGGLQIAAMVTAALGLPIGGVLVDVWGWRTIFAVDIPFALVTFVTATLWIPRDPPLASGRRLRDVADRIDAIGIAGFPAAMSTLLGFLFSLPHPSWLMPAAGIILSALFVGWELSASRPFLDLRLRAANGALSRTYLRLGLTTLCVYSVLYGVTQWLQAARSVSSREAGLLILPMSILSIVIIQPISKRNLIRGPLIAAAGASVLGSIGMLLLGTKSSNVLVIAITLMFGITLGTASSSNQLAMYSNVTGAQLGTASGLFRTFAYVGSIGSSAMIGVMFHSGVTDGGLHIIGSIMTAVSL